MKTIELLLSRLSLHQRFSKASHGLKSWVSCGFILAICGMNNAYSEERDSDFRLGAREILYQVFSTRDSTEHPSRALTIVERSGEKVAVTFDTEDVVMSRQALRRAPLIQRFPTEIRGPFTDPRLGTYTIQQCDFYCLNALRVFGRIDGADAHIESFDLPVVFSA